MEDHHPRACSDFAPDEWSPKEAAESLNAYRGILNDARLAPDKMMQFSSLILFDQFLETLHPAMYHVDTLCMGRPGWLPMPRLKRGPDFFSVAVQSEPRLSGA